MKKPQPVPPGFHAVTPHLVVRDAARTIDFYRRAFGAEESLRITAPDGSTVLHAELRIRDSVVMLAEENAALGTRAPISVEGANGASTCTIALYVDDCDAAFARATAAGAKVVMPPADMFWGDRYALVADPSGHTWSIATHVRDVTPEKMRAALASACG